MEEEAALNEVFTKYSEDPFFCDGTNLGVNSRAMDGDTLLHRAIVRNDIHSVEVLLKNGAEIDAIGDMGNTALHYAVDCTNSQMVPLVLSFGASCNIRNEFGDTASEWAVSCKNTRAVELIGAKFSG